MAQPAGLSRQSWGDHGEDSNSGMNLLRHRLAPLHRDGQFFASVGISGSHRESLRGLREETADLAAIDSVTFAYLARHAEGESKRHAFDAGKPGDWGVRAIQGAVPGPGGILRKGRPADRSAEEQSEYQPKVS